MLRAILSLIQLGVGLYFLVGAFVVLGGFVIFVIEVVRSASRRPHADPPVEPQINIHIDNVWLSLEDRSDEDDGDPEAPERESRRLTRGDAALPRGPEDQDHA